MKHHSDSQQTLDNDYGRYAAETATV